MLNCDPGNKFVNFLFLGRGSRFDSDKRGQGPQGRGGPSNRGNRGGQTQTKTASAGTTPPRGRGRGQAQRGRWSI